MKAKLVVAFAVLFFATAAHADSTTVVVDVTASACYDGCGFGLPFPAPTENLSAQLILQQVTGEFFQPTLGIFFYGTEWQVERLKGKLNGDPMKLSAAPGGTASWLYPETFLNGSVYYELGAIYFTSGGSSSYLWNDNPYNMLNGIPINWNATDPPPVGTPEPSSLLLFGMGLAALIGLRGEKHSRKRGA
jgi:hypothetical protein